MLIDAAGTLVELARPVGEAYAESARAAGVDLDPEALGRGFRRAFAAAPPLAFGELGDRLVREAAERAWWRAIAVRAAREADAPPEFDLDRFFDHAWLRFAGPAPWRVPPDVRPGLRALRRTGCPLAVFSNWDSRLAGVLRGLGLEGYFARVIVSSELPAAKPDPAAFAAARAGIEVLRGSGPPVMIGDRLDHDVRPARAAGWGGVWVDREDRGGTLPDGAVRVESLTEAAPLVTSRDPA